MSGELLGFLALGVSLATGFVWFRRMQEVRLPENRSGFVAGTTAGLLLGLWRSPREPESSEGSPRRLPS